MILKFQNKKEQSELLVMSQSLRNPINVFQMNKLNNLITMEIQKLLNSIRCLGIKSFIIPFFTQEKLLNLSNFSKIESHVQKKEQIELVQILKQIMKNNYTNK